MAELDGDRGGAAVLTNAVSQAEDAILRLPSALWRETASALDRLVEAGIALNALAHRANGAGEPPSNLEVFRTLLELETAVRAVVP